MLRIKAIVGRLSPGLAAGKTDWEAISRRNQQYAGVEMMRQRRRDGGRDEERFIEGRRSCLVSDPTSLERLPRDGQTGPRAEA